MGGKIQMLDLVPGGKCRVSLCCTFLCLYYNPLLKFYLHLFLRPSINNNVCYYGMVHPQVADGKGLQIWKVAMKILKTVNNGWSFSL